MAEAPSKQKIAYMRKLYLALLIDQGRQDLHSLEACTGMPRRTLQDSIKAMSDIGVECRFVQDGPKHRHGYYQVLDWGDHDRDWIVAHVESLVQLLALPRALP